MNLSLCTLPNARNQNKENLLFLQNRLPRTFNIMFYCFNCYICHSTLSNVFCFCCILFLLFSVSTVSTVFCFYASSVLLCCITTNCVYALLSHSLLLYCFFTASVSPSAPSIGCCLNCKLILQHLLLYPQTALAASSSLF